MQTTLVTLEKTAVFEPTLVRHHFEILGQGFAQSIADCSLLSVQSQPKICAPRDPADRSKKPCSAEEKTSYTHTRTRWLCAHSWTSRLLPGLPSRRWLKESKSLFAIKTTDESLDCVVTIWNSELQSIGGPSVFHVDAKLGIVVDGRRTRCYNKLIDPQRVDTDGTNSWMDIDLNLAWSIRKQNRLIKC